MDKADLLDILAGITLLLCCGAALVVLYKSVCGCADAPEPVAAVEVLAPAPAPDGCRVN